MLGHYLPNPYGINGKECVDNGKKGAKDGEQRKFHEVMIEKEGSYESGTDDMLSKEGHSDADMREGQGSVKQSGMEA